ncbi:MAG TPA: hypothetical protein VF821_20610 [Lentzea sp.]
MTQLDPNVPVSVKVDHAGLVPITSVIGEIDIVTDGVIREEVNLLVHNQHEASRLGARLAVIAREGVVRRVLEVSGIDRMIDLYPDIPSVLRTV